MKRRMTLILLALVVAAASLAGCQREADQTGNDNGTVQTEYDKYISCLSQ